MASKPQFDSRLGGDMEVPIEVNTLKFASARAQEIAALSQALDEAKTGNLIFQRLPRHMRRRVMSYNVKRMPKGLRAAYSQQLLKNSGGPVTKHKTPSRKHRRRPSNLLDEYNRRQRSSTWLETHIWHAKRFHMTERWGYRLAHFPNDRSYRACYRAAANHCLLQDISFLCCIELIGPFHTLVSGLSRHTSSSCGLTFAAVSLTGGCREGEIMFYEDGKYPYKPIGTLLFFWKPNDTPTSDERSLWLWAHPSFYQHVISALTSTFHLHIVTSKDLMPVTENEISQSEESTRPLKRMRIQTEDKKPKNVEEIKLATRNVPFERTPKYISSCGSVQMILLKDTLNRFRLTGPLSQAVLREALQLVNDDTPHCDKTMSTVLDPDKDGESHHNFWHSISNVSSPAELPPKIILSLLVKDPRLQIPDKRTKAVAQTSAQDAPCSPPPSNSSRIWSSHVRDTTTQSKLSTAELNKLRSKSLVPGLLRISDENEESIGNANISTSLATSVKTEIPLILIQRPGSKNPMEKRLGFGCGWDVILPAGWAMPFWLAFVFRSARPAGLREASSHELERGKCEFLPPDSIAGTEEACRTGKELREKYFRLPPDKRPNYIKLGVACPFQCQWGHLIRDWSASQDQPVQHLFESCSSYFVCRDFKKLEEIHNFIMETWSTLTKKLPDLNNGTVLGNHLSHFPTFPNQDQALLTVRVEALHRGLTDDLSLICIPSSEDVVNLLKDLKIEPIEPSNVDKNHEVRQKMRKDHKSELVRLRRQRVRSKRNAENAISDQDITRSVAAKAIPHKSKLSPTQDLVSAYNKKMEELWLLNTNSLGSIRNSCSREVAGFVQKGDFCFTEARGCGVGYITYSSLQCMMMLWVKSVPPYPPSSFKSRGIPVLIRSPQSYQYRLAKLSLVIN
ncbi:ribonucleases P/MRP protein subunit POP1 [Thrips palmi]|uniref:Ribonucleases P/MRP protein subunit POP1 n=1 Tax=Thrips palmi TaxID=161013 RepID=A0A6P8ZWT1_THRPL|nr:ribonucleases P/MRP protein subunit POP1 [Thrips palmi]